MISFRKFSCFLTALALMAFALPGMAAPSSTKYFYAVFPTFIADTPGPQDIPVTFFNSTPPPGVSTVNSIKIVAPVGVTINSAMQGTLLLKKEGPFLETAAPYAGRQSWIFTGLAGIKSGNSSVVTLNITVVSANCHSDYWGAFANTGNAYPQGDEFVPTANMQVNSAIGCESLVYCNTQGTPFAFTDVGVFGIRGRYNKDGSPCVQVGVEFTSLLGLGTNEVHLEWDTGSQPYAAFMYSIDWNPMTLEDSEAGWPAKRPWVAWKESPPGTRIPINGLACVGATYPVPYGTLTSGITAAATSLSITTTGQLPPTGSTIIVGSERMLVTGVSGTTLTVLRGREGTTAAAYAAGDWVTGTPVHLPAPLVALASDITAGQTLIPVLSLSSSLFPPTVPPPTPFPAVINTERVRVLDTTTTPGVWVVERGQGGTTATTHTTMTPRPAPLPAFPTYVMSTPLPLIPASPAPPPPYAAGDQAQMCVVDHGFVSVGIEAGTGKTIVQYSTTVVDIGDGYVGIE